MALQFQTRGFVTAQSLADAMRVNRSTVSRALGVLGDEVLRIGAARRARYGLRRTVRNVGRRWPIYRIDETGRAHTLGQLHSAHGGYWLEAQVLPDWLARAYPAGVFPGLPFFLDDARPQGFLGRIIARVLGAAGGFPGDPRDWQGDDVLAHLVAHGSDVPGNWIVGDAMLAAAHAAPGPVPLSESERPATYGLRAEAAMQGQMIGSSAAGEQPKFTEWVHRAGQPAAVLVKFSPPVETPGGRRWSDLLVAEAIAAGVFAAHGDAIARTEVIDAGNRRFLEIERFDRVGTLGRRGVVTLHSLEAGILTESAPDWPAVAGELQRVQLLTPEDAACLRRRWCFGRLIANSDMHLGNASLWFGDAAPLRLAPSYDMLPMLFAPSLQGEIIPRDFRLAPPLPALREDWEAVRPWSLEYWERVESDERVSAEFRRIAAGCRKVVQQAPD